MGDRSPKDKNKKKKQKEREAEIRKISEANRQEQNRKSHSDHGPPGQNEHQQNHDYKKAG